MRRQPILERAVVARILAALKKQPGITARKRHGTAMGVAGDPDIYGTIDGRHFEIEVKRPNDPSSQPTELQTKRLLEWKLAGAITGVARSVNEALVILGRSRPITGTESEYVWLCSGCRKHEWTGTEPPARCPQCGHTRFEHQEAA